MLLANHKFAAGKKKLRPELADIFSETLLEFGRSRLGGTVGIIAMLHTWDQTLKDHFHLHCLVPAGALSLNHSRWIKARGNYLFRARHVGPLSLADRVLYREATGNANYQCSAGNST